jgi:Sec-independent protein translocase protein TatA
MFKFIRNLGCLTIIAFIVFLIVALLFGGDKIRQIGDKTTGVFKKSFHYVADKADDIHKSVLKKIDKLGRPFRDDERDIDNKKP